MSNQELANKVVVVTGAGSTIGLGRAMTLALVQAGARVAMVDINAAALEQTAKEMRAIGGLECLLPIVADVTRPEDAERVIQQTIRELGGFQVLVNNAGI